MAGVSGRRSAPTDSSMWTLGDVLHTLTLEFPLAMGEPGDPLIIPPDNDPMFPEPASPCHGENFTVDVAAGGMNNLDFSYAARRVHPVGVRDDSRPDRLPGRSWPAVRSSIPPAPTTTTTCATCGSTTWPTRFPLRSRMWWPLRSRASC